MNPFELPREILDRKVYDRTVAHMRNAGVRLPLFSQLAHVSGKLSELVPRLSRVDPDAADPVNLFRVHWYNDDARTGFTPTPCHLRLPRTLTGVEAEIVIAFGDRFPMIGAHKVLAAYGCLVPRLVTGAFDPEHNRAVWPSTGNYCRGGIAISNILGCHGVAVLPEGMSAERFRWLEKWTKDPADIVRTPGTESNVKEIYDECARLAKDPANTIVNQFSEFANYLVHRFVTGHAMKRIFECIIETKPQSRLTGFVAATGSAGTLGAGDLLKEHYGARIIAVEPAECPTLLYNGFGEHNIQGVGDKHVPLIHNVMNTDLVVGISDSDTDGLYSLFNTEVGQRYLAERTGCDLQTLAQLAGLGFSGIANMLAAIKVAKYLQLSSDDVLITVATDGATLYRTELDKWLATHAPGGFGEVNAAELFGEHLKNVRVEHLLDMTEADRRRVFNLGYYTWVEQQGIEVADFERRRQQEFWRDLADLIPIWDELIERFNSETGLSDAA